MYTIACIIYVQYEWNPLSTIKNLKLLKKIRIYKIQYIISQLIEISSKKRKEKCIVAKAFFFVFQLISWSIKEYWGFTSYHLIPIAFRWNPFIWQNVSIVEFQTFINNTVNSETYKKHVISQLDFSVNTDITWIF